MKKFFVGIVSILALTSFGAPAANADGTSSRLFGCTRTPGGC